MTRVLVVDDDEALLRLLATLLRVEGIEVVTSPDGNEALDALDRQRPDVVVLDLNMPQMDGATVLRQARERGYDGPVIICSAYGAAAASQELGADASLSKPFELENLVDLVQVLAGPSSSSHNGQRS